MALLTIEDLKKDFGKGHEILKGISLSLDAGETLSIIGPSGGGKTTFLRCLSLLETPSSGKAAIAGDEIFDMSSSEKVSDEEIRRRRQHMGLVFQNFNLFPQYTALENVALSPLLQKKGTPAEIDRKCRELLDRVGLSDRLDRYPHQLSGGQQQRVAIARALALSPEILLFDEPTSALDPELTGEVLKVIRQLAEEKTTMIIVTHEMAFARQVSDRIMFIDQGLAAAYGTPEEIFGENASERVKAFIGKMGAGN